MAREYKDSGIEWIGQIPKEWELRRIQTSLYEINQKNSPIQTDFVLSLTNKDGVIPYEEKGDLGNKSKDNHDEYKLAYPNTIIANSMNILIGSVGISNYFGCVSPVYYVYKNYENADLRFFNYVFTTVPFQKKLRTHANGILEIRLRVSSDTILKQDIATPSLSEQQKISDYLDKVCGEVDEMVALQETMIEELKAYKQSAITEAVTKGLNPNAPMRDSGIDWIGEIPEHWGNCAPLKWFVNIILGKMLQSDAKSSDDSLEYYICAKDVHFGGIEYSDLKKMYFSQDEKKQYKIKKGDMLVVEGGAGAAGASIVQTDIDNIYIQNSIMIARPARFVDISFVCYSLFSLVSRGYVDYVCNKATIPHYTKEKLSKTIIALPPLNEQRAIATYLDTKCSEIDSLIALKQTKIEELKEYKKSVIYEYVTGKKEVV